MKVPGTKVELYCTQIFEESYPQNTQYISDFFEDLKFHKMAQNSVTITSWERSLFLVDGIRTHVTVSKGILWWSWYYSANEVLIEFDGKVDPRGILIDRRRRSFATVKMRNRKISIIFDSGYIRYFWYHPKEGGTPQTNIFWLFVLKIS